jgi:hypothetical protein
MARRCDLQGTKVNAATTLPFDVNALLGVLVFVCASGTKVYVELRYRALPPVKLLLDEAASLTSIFYECVSRGLLPDQDATSLILEAGCVTCRAVALGWISAETAESLVGIPVQHVSDPNN